MSGDGKKRNFEPQTDLLEQFFMPSPPHLFINIPLLAPA
jgi:hypothetical protein